MSDSSCTIFKYLEWHSWLYLGAVNFIQPKLGPFDPRTDIERTRQMKKEICVDCGLERHTNYTDNY